MSHSYQQDSLNVTVVTRVNSLKKRRIEGESGFLIPREPKGGTVPSASTILHSVRLGVREHIRIKLLKTSVS